MTAVNVLFCTTEVHPFSSVGGLGEYSRHLPKELKQAGVNLCIITPLYSSVKRKFANELSIVPGFEESTLKLGEENYSIDFYTTNLPETEIPVYFFSCDAFFGRDGIYNNPGEAKGFADNHRRFAIFQFGILYAIERGVFSPDILHLNDYHTALIPAMIQSRHYQEGALSKVKTLLTLHNLQFQGDCEEEFAYTLGIGETLFGEKVGYERNGRLNAMKAGILTADKIVTVSRNYVRETCESDEFGHGLCHELSKRGEAYVGIMNGIDYVGWNPKTDKLLIANYNKDSLNQKEANKTELLARNGLDASDPDRPLVAMITRLKDNKGIELMMPIIDKMLSFNLNFVFMGTGQHEYHKFLEGVEMRYPSKFGLNLSYSAEEVHAILSGSDFFLSPVQYEPSGQTIMYAMRYGAVPIVHQTGGLADIVQDADDSGKTGVGFSFSEYDSSELLKTIWRAISFYKNTRNYRRVVKRAMGVDYSWTSSGKQYQATYESLLEME